MPDLAWSQFPVATSISSTDILAAVQGALNVQLTRVVFLTSIPLEDIYLQAGAVGKIGLSGGGAAIVQADHGQPNVFGNPGTNITIDANNEVQINVQLPTVSTDNCFQLFLAGLPIFYFDGNGNVTLNSQGVAGMFLSDQSGNSINFNPSSQIQISQFDGGTPFISFIPGNSGDWAGDPGNVQDALTRIAASLATLLGSPIP